MVERDGFATTMSGQCRYFKQHAWKREICTNCFKPREEHPGPAEPPRPNIAKASANLSTDALKLQSILRGRTSCNGGIRKNVAFPDSLAEIIGYGGNDYSDAEDTGDFDDGDNFEFPESMNIEHEAPDSEEDRALGNLTRANTNFNTITANLMEATNSEAKASKSFASLMLGKVQRDPDGKKKTLLVSVTPFGGDDVLPTAKRPVEKKSACSPMTYKALTDEVAIKPEVERTDLSSKNPGKTILSAKKLNTDLKSDKEDSRLKKIVDMPLITSNNVISVAPKNDPPAPEVHQVEDKACEKRIASISRCPAIRKPDSEKPKFSLQTSSSAMRNDFEQPRVAPKTGDSENPRNEITEQIGKKSASDYLENSPKSEVERMQEDNAKNPSSIAENRQKIGENLAERTVEGEAAKPEPISMSERKFSFVESRERAGEPDGKADETEVSELPALPKTLPPVDSRNYRSLQSLHSAETSLGNSREPRSSFLHGEKPKTKPVVPQKPMNLPPKPRTPGPGIPGIKMQNGGCVYQPISMKDTPPKQPQGRVSGNSPKSNDQSMSLPLANSPLDPGSPGYPANKDFKDQNGGRLLPAQNSRSSTNLSTWDPKTNGASPANDTPELPGLSAILFPREKSESLEIEGRSSSEEGSNQSPEDSEIRGEIFSELTSETIRSPNRRRMAPKPPATALDEFPASIFARNPAAANLKSDSPVVREKEKRERASSCSPKFRKAISEIPNPCSETVPEPDSRRSISLSQGNLANSTSPEEKKKARPRFSLKRLLRMGTRKDVNMTMEWNSRNDEIPTTPQPKPRLEIIHPLELDGAAVEVLRHDKTIKSCDTVDSSLEKPSKNEKTAPGPGKPPPPPRNLPPQDDHTKHDPTKLVRPPPIRNDGKLPPRPEKSHLSKNWQPLTSDSIYANLAAEDVAGEVRSGLAPLKPQRTASMRDQTIVQPPMKKRNVPGEIPNGDYEKENAVGRPPTSDSPTPSDSPVYESLLSSSPECDSNLELRRPFGGSNRSNCKRKSDSNAMDSCGGEFKYHQPTFTRSTSLPYCGSETESELYAPYSFYSGDEGPEDDQDWKAKDEEFGILRLRKGRGRSVVHQSLEDNYGALTVANHEALAQFLERLNQPSPVALNLRGLKTSNPRLKDLEIDTESLLTIGKKVFCSAMWKEHAVTVLLAPDTAISALRKEFSLSSISEFLDIVPEKISLKYFAGRTNVNASVAIFPRMQVKTMESFESEIAEHQKSDNWIRQSSFVLLQLVNSLKTAEAKGISQMPKNLDNVVLCRDYKDAYSRLYLLQGLNDDNVENEDEERVSLCQCVLLALQKLKLVNKCSVVQEILSRNRPNALAQVKSALEFNLWGPPDTMPAVVREREIVLQRWLDLERANVLHALVRTRSPLSVIDEHQLIFLVRTSAKIMCEASLLLDQRH